MRGRGDMNFYSERPRYGVPYQIDSTDGKIFKKYLTVCVDFLGPIPTSFPRTLQILVQFTGMNAN